MSEAIDPHERRRLTDALERLEERLYAAPHGLHRTGPPAASDVLASQGLPEGPAMFWQTCDGLDVASGEAKIFALSALSTAALDVELLPGDRVIGERGRDVYVLAADPWAEGAEVVVIDDEEGNRDPEASSVIHLALGLLAEAAVLYDEQGDFRDEVFDEFGQLLPEAKRRMLRRRLDVDPDAPRPRRDLARLLREAGEHRGARMELQQVLRRAPEWWAAHLELGLTFAAEQNEERALAAFAQAAEHARDSETQAYCWAWAATVGSPADRSSAAGRARLLRPEFPSRQAQGARALLEVGRLEEASHMIDLGLAVSPMDLELLDLRRQVRASIASSTP